jgi:molybdenum cofactor cytidylyltransferase
MGEANKLLLPVDNEPLVRVCARTLLAAGLSPVIAVLGSQGDEVRQALAGLEVRCIENPRYLQGMGTSLAAGVAALPATVDTAVIALGDMPSVDPETIRALLRAGGERGIVVPEHRGRRGHPVVFDLSRYREELMALSGDRGARTILKAHPDDVARVPVDNPGVLLDLDTRQEYETWLSRD